MNRRGALAVFGCWIAGARIPLAWAQRRVWRVGFLYFASETSAMQSGRYRAFVEGLTSLGYAEGRDFVVEARFGEGKAPAMPQLAAELLSRKVDIIVTGGTPAAKAAQAATKTIPIVFATSADPVRDGLVASLARPGGNITGVTSGNAEVDLKHAELLKAVSPAMTTVAVLTNPANSGHTFRLKGVEAAAAKLGVKAVTARAETAHALPDAIDGARRAGAEGLIVLNDSFFLQNERQIAELALKHRLASICALGNFADAGGLLSYGANLNANFRRAAAYVDRILKGARPADLPVERPLTFDLAINFKTAQSLGIAIPKEIALMAARAIK